MEKTNSTPEGLKTRLDVLGEAADGYQLKWIGKNYARLQSGAAAAAVIVPDTEHNAKPENAGSGNIFFTGDNLEALKHLQNTRAGSVDMIYIDPPYNTGKEFVYNDTFNFSDDTLRAALGMTEAEIKHLHTTSGKNSHSAWLTFMYPRLKIARKLLKDTGVIFISIDDNEQANLKLLCDEIFGEENFVCNFIWNHRKSSQNDTDVSLSHNYTFVFAKNRELFKFNPLGIDESKFSNPDNDSRGDWTADPMDAPHIRPNLTYPITNPNTGGQYLPPNGRHWRISREKFAGAVADNRIIFGKTGKGRPQIKRFKFEALKKGVNPFTIWTDIGTAADGTKELMNLFAGAKIFDTPKPVSLIKHIIQIAAPAASFLSSDSASPRSSLILDFFAGSGTTAHAVMQLNAEDAARGAGGNRRWILCALDEPTKPESEARKAGFNTIDEIARERIKRAAKKIADENLKPGTGFSTPDTPPPALDLGFLHYRVLENEYPPRRL